MNRFYLIFDTTKDYTDIKHALYTTIRTNTDILGQILAFAERNDTSIDKIRVFCFNTKAEYDTSYKNWLNKVAETERQNKQRGNS